MIPLRHWSHQLAQQPLCQQSQTLATIRKYHNKGITLPPPPSSLLDAHAFFSRQFLPLTLIDASSSPTPNLALLDHIPNPPISDPVLHPLLLPTVRRFSHEAIASALSDQGNGKAGGIDGLTSELLPPSDIIIATLSGLFTWFLEAGVLPSSWSNSITFPIYKGKGNRLDWSNQRPIALLPIIRKIWERCILPSVHTVPIDICQGGFRENRGTMEQVACLQECVDQLLHEASPTMDGFS